MRRIIVLVLLLAGACLGQGQVTSPLTTWQKPTGYLVLPSDGKLDLGVKGIIGTRLPIPKWDSGRFVLLAQPNVSLPLLPVSYPKKITLTNGTIDYCETGTTILKLLANDDIEVSKVRFTNLGCRVLPGKPSGDPGNDQHWVPTNVIEGKARRILVEDCEFSNCCTNSSFATVLYLGPIEWAKIRRCTFRECGNLFYNPQEAGTVFFEDCTIEFGRYWYERATPTGAAWWPGTFIVSPGLGRLQVTRLRFSGQGNQALNQLASARYRGEDNDFSEATWRDPLLAVRADGAWKTTAQWCKDGWEMGSKP